jgi:hypothetical protein
MRLLFVLVMAILDNRKSGSAAHLPRGVLLQQAVTLSFEILAGFVRASAVRRVIERAANDT